MKSKISFTALLCLLSVCLSSCESDLNVDVSQKEQNIELLRSIADSMGCNVEIELFNRQATEPLTALDIEKFKAKFKEIVAMDGMRIELSPVAIDSRVLESNSYRGIAGYDGHNFNVSVYWTLDSATGEFTDIVGGMGGRAIDDYKPYDYTVREMMHMGQTLHSSDTYAISITLKSDYIVTEYSYMYNTVMNQIRSKVAAEGYVYIQQNSGTFTVHSSGEGSWGDDLI